jgi:RHS repeat-associated protein
MRTSRNSYRNQAGYRKTGYRKLGYRKTGNDRAALRRPQTNDLPPRSWRTKARFPFFRSLLALLMFFACAGLTARSAQADPATLHISWDHPTDSESGLVRAVANGGVWIFTVAFDPDVEIVDGPHWSYPGDAGAAPEWGSWGINADNLSWLAPTTGGTFTVSVSGRMRHKGTGAGGGGGGMPEEKDFSATWSGQTEMPHDPLPPPCPPGSPDPSDSCPGGDIDPVSGRPILRLSSLGSLPSSTSANDGNAHIGPAFNRDTMFVTLNTDCFITVDSAGNVTIKQSNGCETTFLNNGGVLAGGPSDHRSLIEESNGSYVLHVPADQSDDGKPHYYTFASAPAGEGLMAQAQNRSLMAGEAMDEGEGEVTYPPMYLSSQEDEYGNAVTYERDENGRLLSMTDANGNTTTVTYDDDGHVTQIEDAFGRILSYTYDEAGRLASQTDISGQTTTYTYDDQNRITSMTGALGTTSYTYEGTEGGDGGTSGYSAPGEPMGYAKRTTVEYPDGSKAEYFYDGNGNYWYVAPEDYVEYTSEHNNSSEDVPKTKWKVEEVAGQAKITETTSPSGARTSYEFDGDTGELIGTTDPLGNESGATYNDQGNPLTMTGPDGKTLTLVYAENGEDVTAVKDPENNTVATYTYNDKHQILTATDADDNTTTNTYTTWGDPETVTDAAGKTTTYHYDDDRLLTSIDVEGDTIVSYTYDSRQRVKTQTDASGFTVTYDYDDADRVIKTTYPDGTHEDVSYAACCGAMGDKPAYVTDRSGRGTEYDYDAMGRPIRVTDTAGNQVEYEYDLNGNLTRLVDSNNNATRFEYNADGLVSRKIYADDTYETYTYDDAGNLIGHRDAMGNVVNYAYDEAGRLTTIDYPHDADVTYTYDALGRVAASTDGIGTTEYSYDDLGRLISEDGPWDDDTITYTYDTLGRRTALGINGTTQASYAYDDLDRLTSVTKGTSTFGYTYDGASDMLTQLTLPGGAKTEYSYDTMQRLTGVQSLKSDATTNISNFVYGYNDRDVRTSVEKTLGAGSTQTINYTYDDIDQLTHEQSTETTPLLDKEYSYDAMGNRTSSSVSGTSTSYASNDLNQITQASVGGVDTEINYDANGNMIAVGTKQFAYNDADELTTVVVPGETKSEFTYDSQGRKRISTEYTWDAAANDGAGDWVQSDQTKYIYDGMDLVQERGADGTVKASYVRDGNIGGVLSMTNADGTFYYHYDGNGNVVALTDASDNIVAQYSYDAYGNLLSSSGSEADKNPFRFSSKYYDGYTGLYDYGLRHYDAALGRWINRDPIAEQGGLNLYGMVLNNPINKIDSYGLDEGDAYAVVMA